MDPLIGKNWKRIVAREFLLLVGIAGVCALVAGGMWMWNGVVEGRLERARKERKEVERRHGDVEKVIIGKIRQLESENKK
jgi:hypothetical protein